MSKLNKLYESVAVLLILSSVYYVLRLLTANIPLAFYDEGETLYHLLSVLKDQVPYLHDHSHHFLGYITPYILLEKVRGFGAHLIREMAFISQVLMAFGVFWILRIYSGFVLSLAGALLAISAREPFVISFYQTMQNNLVLVYMILLALLFLRSGKIIYFYLGAVLSGLLFSLDQRAVFFTFIPFASYFLCKNRGNLIRFSQLLIGIFLAALVPMLYLIYIYKNGALNSFIEQCFIFPFNYRAASQSFGEKLIQAIKLHEYLITDSLVLTSLGILGYFYALKLLTNRSKYSQDLILLTAIAPAIFCFAALGGRQYDYYTVGWLPYFSILAVLPLAIENAFSRIFKKAYLVFIVAPLIFALSQAVFLKDSFAAYQGDGVKETVDFLKANLKDKDTFYVWGYRLEIYARLERLSAYPFASTIMIEPDGLVKDAGRRAHIYPKYQQLFFELFEKNPATYIVKFEREGYKLDSETNDFVSRKLSEKYQKVFSIVKKDFKDKECYFEVYKLDAIK